MPRVGVRPTLTHNSMVRWWLVTLPSSGENYSVIGSNSTSRGTKLRNGQAYPVRRSNRTNLAKLLLRATRFSSLLVSISATTNSFSPTSASLHSNRRICSFVGTSDEFSREDRWSVQEFLFLCEGEHFLRGELNRSLPHPFRSAKSGNYYKGHGESAAATLRNQLGYAANEVPRNVYEDFRSIGIYLFRRKLNNSNISGLFIRHPIAGECVLVNYSEDIYRQRFTVAHEAAHAILDTEEELVVSFSWDRNNLIEIRANIFASRYLLPHEFLRALPDPTYWSDADAIEWAHQLRVSTEALSFALRDAGIVDDAIGQRIRGVRVPPDVKVDPELPQSLSGASRERKLHLLSQGLSDHYVSLCFDAYAANVISADRLREQLLLDNDVALVELAGLYGRSLKYGD